MFQLVVQCRSSPKRIMLLILSRIAISLPLSIVVIYESLQDLHVEFATNILLLN